MNQARVVLNDVVRRYGAAGSGDSIVALAGVSIVIEPGEAVAVVGESGGGKSTLLNLIGALDRPTSGTIAVGGIDVAQLSQVEQARLRRQVALVGNPVRLLDSLGVLENVAAPLVPYAGPREARARARDALSAVGMATRSRSLPNELSCGQSRRVAIARALALEPGVLLADEPTASLDAFTSLGVLGLLFASRERHGTSLVLATHDPAVASACDRVIRLHEGRVVPASPPPGR